MINAVSFYVVPLQQHLLRQKLTLFQEPQGCQTATLRSQFIKVKILELRITLLKRTTVVCKRVTQIRSMEIVRSPVTKKKLG